MENAEKIYTVADLDAQIEALDGQRQHFAALEKSAHDQLHKTLGALEHARHIKATFALPLPKTEEDQKS